MESENRCKQIQIIFEKMFMSVLPGEEIKNGIRIQKLESGLSNYLYLIIVNDKKYFLKIFGEISTYHLVNRKFETDLIYYNSKNNLCGSYIFTDYTTFRVEKYLENIRKPDDKSLLSDEMFINKMLNCLIGFQFSYEDLPLDSQSKYEIDKSLYVKGFLHNVVKVAKKKIELFEEEYTTYTTWANLENTNNFNLNLTFETYIKKINSFLDNYEFIYDELLSGLEEIPQFLNHNDLHKYNILLKSTSQNVITDYNLLIIDYEYACFNYIGFDIINYCIESFFDLEYNVYPYYCVLVENVEVLFQEKKYYEFYVKYLDLFLAKLKEVKSDEYFQKFRENIFPIIITEKYFLKVSGLCSLFWFYCSLISLNFSKIINKDSFNYMDYSLDRLKIYECAKSRIDN
jgi:thiamine kinase-like enzyme